MRLLNMGASRIGTRMRVYLLGGMIPLLVVAGLILRQMTASSITRAYESETEQIASFVLNTIEQEQRQLAHYLQFVAENPTFESAFELAATLGDTNLLQQTTQASARSLELGDIAIFNSDSALLLRSRPGAAPASTAETELARRAMQQKEPLQAIICTDNHASMVAIAGIKAGGAIKLELDLDAAFLKRMKTLSGAEVSIFHGPKIVASSLDDASTVLLPDDARPALERSRQTVCRLVDASGGRRFVAIRPLAGFDSHDALQSLMLVSTDATAYQSAVTRMTTALVVCFGALLAVVGIIAYFVARSIAKPLERAIGKLSSSSQQVCSASEQVAGSSKEMASGSSRQAAALEQTSSALEEMNSMTRRNADSADHARQLAAEAKGAADRGNAAVGKMGTAIAEIQRSAAQTAEIIKVINDIAFQTNLLALNAAVEAARAGDAGKGFAVVAQEVRSLALRSAEAAQKTASLIESSVQSTENGVKLSQEVEQELGGITGAAGKVNSIIDEIATACREQAQGIAQVGKAVSEVDQVTQSSAQFAEQSASASSSLAREAQQMDQVLQQLTQLVGGTRS
jgi:ABC-type transporter Mla subunit MlaD